MIRVRWKWIGLIAAAMFAVGAEAQTPPAEPMRPAAFARYVPSSAPLFIATRELDELNQALSRAHAWSFLPLLAGGAAPAGAPFDLRAAVKSFVGPASSINVDDLMHTELGLVAGGWSELGSAVWLVRLADKERLDRWFPREKRISGGDGRPVPFFRTDDGVMVSVRDDIACLARRRGSGTLLRDTMSLVIRGGENALAESAVFRELSSYLPADALAFAYVAAGKRTTSGRMSGVLGPSIDQAVVGLYEGGGRIDVAIRAALSAPRRHAPLSAQAVDRFLKLPQTTLFAAATTVDWDQLYKAAAETDVNAGLVRYTTLLAGFRDPASSPPAPFPKPGPHVILAWDQDLQPGSYTPQLAVMIECAEAAALSDELVQIVNNSIKVIAALDGANGGRRLTIEESTHLGTRIRHVPMGEYAQQSRLPLVGLLKGTEPSWAVVGNWLVAAVNRRQLERILDAQHGLVPTIAAVSDVREMSRRTADRNMLSILQAGLASGVLERWLREFEAGSPSLLDPAWWTATGRSDPGAGRQLGIGMQAIQAPGTVIVARVYAESPADGRLRPGDRIIGIDGQLLDLASPNADLRARLGRGDAASGPTLRVQRDGTTLDVILPREGDDSRHWSAGVKPADAVRELASLARSLQFASFAVLASEETRYAARLSLRFAPSPP